MKNLGKYVFFCAFLTITASFFPGTVFSGDAGIVPSRISELGDPWFDEQDQTGGLFYQAMYDFDYGDPTPAEQAHLEAINRARMDPTAEAARLGIDLFEGVPPGAISGVPTQPLVLNAKLITAARLHSQDMINNDYFAHESLDGTSPFDRMQNAGYSYSTAGENLALIGSTGPLDEVETVLELHDNLFIDENYPDRGHRVNLLKNDFKEVGIGVAVGSYNVYNNTYIVTCDFGTALQYTGAFLLGVVYDDLNKDSFYTAGEGIANVSIAVSGVENTVTASAGGYGIPVSTGTYDITATLPDGKVAQKTVTIVSENKKIDFLESEFTASGSVSPPTPTVVGSSAGIHTLSVSAGTTLSLQVNTTNAANAQPVYEWIWFMLNTGGQQSPIYAITASGLQSLMTATSLESVTWSPGVSPVYDLGKISMADLGLAAGDSLIYGYAYTESDPASLTVENMVTIQVQ